MGVTDARKSVSDLPHSLRVYCQEGLAPGPRLLVLGAVHGNETCGTRAIERVLGGFERGARDLLRGSVTFVPITNPLAYRRGTRSGDRNLN
ncbi:MAG: succinylglutamate desuccinylase, partial [Gammaproteobacteria bacterium]|nr:succinylglutamate desuccinylase [Gammaproteobacteria bacterium]